MDTHEIEETFLHLSLGIEPVRHARWQGIPGEEMTQKDALILEQFQQACPWGLEATVDLFWCHPARICDPETIRAFASALCDFIHMRRYGEPLIVHFGTEEHLSGYTLVQLIETSNITAHFIDKATPTQGNAGCLNIFSCAWFPPYAAAAFCQEWFGAQEVEVAVTLRGPTQSCQSYRSFTETEEAASGEGGNAC